MFTYFPVIQNDELLFSVFARYHARSLNKKERQTLREMGIGKMNPIIPQKIQHLLEKLKYFQVPDKDYFFKTHTVFGYYKNFLSSIDRDNLYKYMVYGEDENISVLKLISTHLPHLKYCPECVKKDFEELGEIYWRVLHQYPTIIICPTHNIPLEQYPLPTWEVDFETVSKNYNLTTKERNLSKKTLFHATNFLHQNLYLTNNDLDLYSKTKSQIFYLLFLERGFVLESGKIDVEKLKKKIIQYFGIEFLQLINFNLNVFEEIKESPLLFDYHTGPGEKLVFINLLFNSLTDFINYKYKLPNGEATPFECLNPFCKSYKQRRVNYIQVFLEEDFYKVQIHFRCDECMEEFDKIFRTKDWSLVETRINYSEKWNLNLLKLVYEDGLDLERVSFKTNLETLEIERILLKENKYEHLEEGISKKIREDLIRLINANINKSMGEIKQLDFPLYAFMKRNEYSGKLNTQEVPQSEIIINGEYAENYWRKRDKKVLLYFKQIVHKGIIRGKVKVYYWINYDIEELHLRGELKYLPMTSKYIEKHRLFSKKLFEKKLYHNEMSNT